MVDLGWAQASASAAAAFLASVAELIEALMIVLAVSAMRVGAVFFWVPASLCVCS